jgi:helix-turn-helix protein
VSVVPLPRPEPDLVEMVAELRDRVTALERRMPPPRFTIPEGWLSVGEAACISGFSKPHVSRWARRNEIVSVKAGGRRYIDPVSLEQKIARLIKPPRAPSRA